MGYAQALEKAWNDVTNLTAEKRFNIRMLSDEYEIDVEKRSVLSLSCNAPPKEHISIILLHYLIQKLKLKVLPSPQADWIDFRYLEGGNVYYPAFRKRVIEVVLRKYGRNPEGLLDVIGRLPAKRIQIGDIGIVVQVFEEIPILISLYRGDDDFGPEANILFDRSIKAIFCTEDIVVLADIVVHLL
ncbi:MAG: DUF3786 domain-containing protein [Candidatus Omnitrophica bacterium]|nr:DUF3786 domain-containing protein [Candidatus Omnitrophota bacterium]